MAKKEIVNDIFSTIMTKEMPKATTPTAEPAPSYVPEPVSPPVTKTTPTIPEPVQNIDVFDIEGAEKKNAKIVGWVTKDTRDAFVTKCNQKRLTQSEAIRILVERFVES